MDNNLIILGVVLTTCFIHWLTVFLLVLRARTVEKPRAWYLLGLAVGLLAIQKTYVLALQVLEGNLTSLSLVSASLGLLIAGLLLGGMVQLFPLLYLVQRNRELLAVIEERNVIIHQFHERIARALQRIQISMEVGKPMNCMVEQVAEMSTMLQAFLEDLKAGVLLGNKFEVALKTLVEDVSQESSFPITVQVASGCEDNISREQGAEFLHILREALCNSVQHSHAKKGHVCVRMTGTDLILEVSDNGKGFEVDLVRVQGQGLGSMVNRAKKIGARLKIHSQPMKGTSVFIEVPLRGNHFEGNHSVSSHYAPSDTASKVYASSILLMYH